MATRASRPVLIARMTSSPVSDHHSPIKGPMPKRLAEPRPPPADRRGAPVFAAACRGGRGPHAAAGGVGWSIDLVAESAGAPPDPIPNSAVKPRRAHGTASQDVGE